MEVQGELAHLGMVPVASLRDSSFGGVHGEWGLSEAVLSSTWRELRAARLGMESFLSSLAGQDCVLRCDNQAAVSVLQNGSKWEHLHHEAIATYSLCSSNGIRLVAEWVPREANEMADYLSKVVGQDDWRLQPAVFRQIDGLWGPHSVDCFASTCTSQLGRFFSRWWEPHSSGVDAFTQVWAGENV